MTIRLLDLGPFDFYLGRDEVLIGGIPGNTELAHAYKLQELINGEWTDIPIELNGESSIILS